MCEHLPVLHTNLKMSYIGERGYATAVKLEVEHYVCHRFQFEVVHWWLWESYLWILLPMNTQTNTSKQGAQLVQIGIWIQQTHLMCCIVNTKVQHFDLWCMCCKTRYGSIQSIRLFMTESTIKLRLTLLIVPRT